MYILKLALISLNLSHNIMNFSSISFLTKALEINKNLKKLSLNNCNIEDQSGYEVLKVCGNLVELNIAENLL